MTGLLPYDDDKGQRTLVCCHGGIIVAVLIAYFSSLEGSLRVVIQFMRCCLSPPLKFMGG